MITIRKAVVGDAEAIAACLWLAMHDIIYEFIGEKDQEKATAFLLHFVQKKNNQYSYQNCWLAEDDKTIVAAANIYNGAQLHELRLPVLNYLRTNFNKYLHPEDETGEGEYYIDSIGVTPDHQGRGIGSKILQFLIDEYVVRREETLGLLVEETNPDAKRLYIKLGFKSVEPKIFMGKNMVHLQRNPPKKIKKKNRYGIIDE